MIRPALLAFALTFAATAAAGAPYAVNQHYRLVQPAVPTEVRAGQVEVIEFFSIGCPHCSEFEPYLQSWMKRKPANVKVVRVPATFNPYFKILAKAYFALEDVKGADKGVPALFDALHVNKEGALLGPLSDYHRRVVSNDAAGAAEAEQEVLAALAGFLERKAGVNAKKFRSAWSSFSMTARLARADATYRRYGITGVPYLAINGKYTTGAGRPLQIRGYDELMKVTEHLISLESKPAK
jgi:thiol:disulfide interchange protein DsbA